MRHLLVIIATVLSSGIAWGACAPEKMARIVFRDATPGIDPDSFAAKPKTLYRLGTRYSRVEEAPDPERGLHGLAIAAEPDLWMINLADETGQHMIDPSEPYVVHAQVFGGPTDPDLLKSFEFGCELAYMKAKGVQPETAQIAGRTLDSYKVSEGAHTVFLAIISSTERPLYTSLFKDGNLVRVYQYVQYDLHLEPDLLLFKPPAGITVTEARR